VVAIRLPDKTVRLDIDDPDNTGVTLITIDVLKNLVNLINERYKNEEASNPSWLPINERTIAHRLFYRTTRDRSAVARLRRRDSHRSRQSSGSN